MNLDDLSAEEVRRAKALAAGPLGQEFGKFPLRFARAILLGDRPRKDGVQLNNGTLTLLLLKGRPVGVTCSHVLDAYRRRCASNVNTVIQVGDCAFDPSECVIDEDPSLDLATLDLSSFSEQRLLSGGWLGSQFHEPTRWPPGAVSEGDFVSFGGYPGTRRRKLTVGEYEFTSFSVGTVPIRSVSSDHFVIQLERECWVTYAGALPDDDSMTFQDLGGLSGAPVFIGRTKPIVYFEFVGIVYEFSSAFDLVYVRPASLIRQDGTLCRQPT